MYLHYIIDKDDFDLAGEASSKVKKALTQLGINPVTIKKAAISMYEAEINAFIHGGGGDAFVDIDKDRIKIVIEDHGNGIEDLSLAMQEGFSTASEFIRQRLEFRAHLSERAWKHSVARHRIDDT